jgi:hypothetical protein
MRLEELQKIIINKAYLDENALLVMARMGEDPGHEYFSTLKKELRELFDLLKSETKISRELASALFNLSHSAQVNYQAAINHGVKLREDLMDPDMLEIEILVESIFSGEWHELFE